MTRYFLLAAAMCLVGVIACEYLRNTFGQNPVWITTTLDDPVLTSESLAGEWKRQAVMTAGGIFTLGFVGFAVATVASSVTLLVRTTWRRGGRR